MSLNLRRLLLVSLGILSMIGVACSSNNKGIIVGKWKVKSMPGLDAALIKQLEQGNTYVYIEFKADNSMIRGFDIGDPLIEKEFAKSGEKKSVSCKYKLLNGDLVEFYDMPKDMQEKGEGGGGLFGAKDRARTRIKITGENMTWTDDDGKSASFVRVN